MSAPALDQDIHARIHHANMVLEAWQDAEGRCWIEMAQAIRSASPDAGEAKYRHHRAKTQARAAADRLQALRDQRDRERPPGGDYGA